MKIRCSHLYWLPLAILAFGSQNCISVAGHTSPWGYRCDSSISNTCVKEERTQTSSLVSLPRCKLTCNPDGVLWPQPLSSNLTTNVVEFLPADITQSFNAPSEVTTLLKTAVVIFKENIQKNENGYSNKKSSVNATSRNSNHNFHLNITVSGEETRLALEIDESYTLSLTTKGDLSTAIISAPTYFGARHALETLSQLIEFDEDSGTWIVISEASINDSPAFTYRGVLVDTSRNFISVQNLERTLDGMAFNKLNTFHWHITDASSFPLQLESLPNMSYYGAYSPEKVYTKANVIHLVEYGRVRGIRVMPEFDSPAHVGNGFQWGPKEGLGDLAVCVNKQPWASYCVSPPCGQLNIANTNMYNVLSQIYADIVEMFSPIDIFHFGGDEVNVNCWNSTKEIVDWMVQSGFNLTTQDYYEQWSVFQGKALDLFTTANKKKVPGILWTSPLTDIEHIEQYVPKEEYIVQIWTTADDPIIGQLLGKGYKVILSNYDHLYLDCGFSAWIGDGNNWCTPYKSWQTVYDNNPIQIATNQTSTFDKGLVLGGEIAIWSEQVDDMALDSRIWPRGAAHGERMWSNPDHDWKMAEARFINHRQRMVRRGIKANRIQPEYCHQNEGLCV